MTPVAQKECSSREPINESQRHQQTHANEQDIFNALMSDFISLMSPRHLLISFATSAALSSSAPAAIRAL